MRNIMPVSVLRNRIAPLDDLKLSAPIGTSVVGLAPSEALLHLAASLGPLAETPRPGAAAISA
ncbi:hypothetical protein ACFWG0_27570 [Streptomyces yangpuensis]|uniref:hypothetical protein n=1 Tax=Streptomyces yangpuensis TaxID=1648182 RepID=UPI003665B860